MGVGAGPLLDRAPNQAATAAVFPCDHIGHGVLIELCNHLVHQRTETAWSQITFAVFDAPGVGGGFEERLQRARERLAGIDPQRVMVVNAEPCEDVATIIIRSCYAYDKKLPRKASDVATKMIWSCHGNDQKLLRK